MLIQLLLAVGVMSQATNVWPDESHALSIELINNAKVFDAVTDPGRIFISGDLSVRLRDGKKMEDGLYDLYRALPPKWAFHDVEQERERIHPSKIGLVISERNMYARRTYATEEGPLSIMVSVFSTPKEVEEYFLGRTTGPGVSGPVKWRSDGFSFGDDAWMPVKDPHTAYVRDGCVLTRVQPPFAPSPDRVERIEALVQAVRFRLMVASHLIEGGQERTVEVRPGAKVKVRMLDDVAMVCLKELESVGYETSSSANGLKRSCLIKRRGKSVQVDEYRKRFTVQGVQKTMSVAPFAYDGDLWLPLQTVRDELEKRDRYELAR